MKHLLILLLIGGSFLSCQEDELTQEQALENLQTLLNEIESLSASVRCEDASQWSFTAYGSKACGGHVGYIAYSREIDTEYFLEKVEEYTDAQAAFNERWEVFSDCSLPAQPAEVVCVDGHPTFSF